MWDEGVPIHTATSFDDADGFEAGRSAWRPFERAETRVGPGDPRA
jgi:hypothetical protein